MNVDLPNTNTESEESSLIGVDREVLGVEDEDVDLSTLGVRIRDLFTLDLLCVEAKVSLRRELSETDWLRSDVLHKFTENLGRLAFRDTEVAVAFFSKELVDIEVMSRA